MESIVPTSPPNRMSSGAAAPAKAARPVINATGIWAHRLTIANIRRLARPAFGSQALLKTPIHVIARRLDDMSPMLASVGGRSDVADVYRVSRADVVKHGMGPDPREPAERPRGKGPRDIYIPDLRLGSGIILGQPAEGIKVKARDFR